MSIRAVHAVVAIATSLIVVSYSAHAGFEETIPPENLRQYAPEIVKGNRPVVIRITQPMIWGLRDKPDQGGDVYTFDLDPSKLSSVQQDIVRKWVQDGRKVWFWGYYDAERYATLFHDTIMCSREHQTPTTLSSHPVNTDVESLDFRLNVKWGATTDIGEWSPVLVKYPPETEVIASDKNGVVAGRIPYGRGSLYVALFGNYWTDGKDRDRWSLNFQQWMLDYRVPGAAETKLGIGTNASEPGVSVPQDRILLKNGDTISGRILIDKFTVKTSYADLSFDLSQVETVVLEGAGQNIELMVLRTGDKLSGVIGPETVKIELTGGQETEIEKDKIKEIVLQQ